APSPTFGDYKGYGHAGVWFAIGTVGAWGARHCPRSGLLGGRRRALLRSSPASQGALQGAGCKTHPLQTTPFGVAETFHLTGAPGRRERGGRKGSRLSSVVSLNARPARESFAGASGVDAGNGTDFNFFICM
ncbi:unnamed protein product, partial [Prorocentrum cordatum]